MDNNISTSKITSKLISLLTSVIMIALFMSLKIQKIEVINRNYIVLTIIVSIVFASIAILFKYIYLSQKQKYVYYQIIDFLLLLNSALLFIQLFFVLVFFPATVNKTSMYPNLREKDNLIVRSLATPKHFDIVVLELDQKINYYSVDENEKLIVKRIIAMEGDTFYFDINGILFLNGIEVDEKYLKNDEGYFKTDGYIYNSKTPAFQFSDQAKMNGVNICTPNEECRVPKDYLFVLGDNRTQSLDSRHFGLFHKSQIIGIVIYRQIGILKWEKM